MSYQPYYISAFENDSGLNTYYEPFLIPEKAFPYLNNAYAWRGRVKRKLGNTFLNRLRRNLTAQASGNIASAGAGPVNYNLFTGMGLLVTEPNASIEPGNLTNISIAIAAPINQTLSNTDGSQTLIVTGAGPISSATIDYATGIITMIFTGAAGASASTYTGAYYPGLPVMGLRTQETPAISENEFIAFDTKYAYRFASGSFSELSSTAPTTWNGKDHQFFWTTNYATTGTPNYYNLFWATNFNNGQFSPATYDPIYYYDTTTWTSFTPLITAADTLYTAKLIIPFRNRLLLLNTYEGTTVGTRTAAKNFPNRIRWSWSGAPTDVQAFRSDLAGRGGYYNLPTNEQIVTAEFVKDVLLIKTETASWKGIFTGNSAVPFIFEKINTELGSESEFSQIPFDRGVFTVGNYGITVDDGVNVSRIDSNIPQAVFNINNANFGPARVYGIRDYANEMVYWTYPSQDNDAKFPNYVLAYNYVNETWAFFDDSFTCYGYLYNPNSTIWSSTYALWGSSEATWGNSQNQPFFPQVIAGNQQGFVLKVQNETGESKSLCITSFSGNSVTIKDHNLKVGQFIQIKDTIGSMIVTRDSINYDLNDFIFKVVEVTSVDVVVLKGGNEVLNGLPEVISGTYYGGGYVVVLNNVDIWTKVFVPFYQQGSAARLGYVDLLLDRTPKGRVTANLYIDENGSYPINTNSNDNVGGSSEIKTCPENITLYPFQSIQQKIWHRFFTYAVCQNFQLEITMDDEQMFGPPDEDGNYIDTTYADSDVTLHALALFVSKNSRLAP